MIRPKETKEITRKILELAGEGKDITVDGCIHRWHGEHFSDDWDECCQSLVDEGELEYTGTELNGDKIMRKKVKIYEPRLTAAAEFREIANAPLLYKVAHDNGDGTYSSCFIGQSLSISWANPIGTPLQYRIGMVTDSLKGSQGIYCYDSLALQQAKNHAKGDSMYSVKKPSVVLQVRPLGAISEIGEELRVEAVYVEGVVKESESPSSFSIGDKVRVKADVHNPKYSWDELELDDVGVVECIEGDKMEVRFPTFCKGKITWSAHAPEMELAPKKEEWVDITKECTFKFAASGSFFLDIWYGKALVGNIGMKTTKSTVAGDKYKVVTEDKPCSWGTFHVYEWI